MNAPKHQYWLLDNRTRDDMEAQRKKYGQVPEYSGKHHYATKRGAIAKAKQIGWPEEPNIVIMEYDLSRELPRENAGESNVAYRVITRERHYVLTQTDV